MKSFGIKIAAISALILNCAVNSSAIPIASNNRNSESNICLLCRFVQYHVRTFGHPENTLKVCGSFINLALQEQCGNMFHALKNDRQELGESFCTVTSMCAANDIIKVKEFSKIIKTGEGDREEHGFYLSNDVYTIVDEKVETKIRVTLDGGKPSWTDLLRDPYALQNIQFILLSLMTIFGFLLVALLLVYPEAVDADEEEDEIDRLPIKK